MELFKLFGSIAIKNDEANQSIDETSGKAEGFASKLTKGIGTVAKWGTAIVGGATAAGAAMVGFASNSASAADRVDKMSQKIGISRQAYQELDFICSQSGTSVDGLQAGMKSLTAAMDGAKSGTAANVEQFEKLGVAVSNSDGTFRSQEEVFFDTVTALQGMGDQTEKARLATELFGRSGTELMPLLNGASGSIDEMRKQAHDLGLVLDDELINNGVNLTDSLDQTKRAFASIGIQLGGALMPIVEQASDYIQQSLPAIQALIGRLTPIITSLLSSILPPLMQLGEAVFPILFDLIEQLIPPITQVVEAILPVIVQLIQMLLPPLIQIIQMIMPVLVQLITALLPLLDPILQLLQPLIDLLMAILEPLIQLLSAILPPLIAVITAVVEVISGVLQPVFEAIAQVISGVLNVAFETISGVVQSVVNFVTSHWQGGQVTLTGIFNAIKSVITTVWNAIKSVTTTVFNVIKSVLTTVWNAIKSTVTTVVNAIKTTVTTVWNAIKTAVTTAVNAIKSTVTTVWNAIKTAVTTAVNGIKSTVTTVWNAIKSTITSVINGIKSTITSVFNTIKSTITSILNGVKSTFTSVWNGIKSTVTSVINGVKSTISSGLNGAKNTVTSVLNAIKSKFSSILNGAASIVSGAINKIKGFFNFSWSLPKLKMPHPTISGSFSLNPPSVPHFGIEWYKKAMDEPYMFTKPTIFDYDPSTGQAKGAGEAGDELMIGKETMLDMVRTAVSAETNELTGKFNALLALLERFLPEILHGMNRAIVLDNGVLVGELAPGMDEALGDLLRKRERG